MVQGRPPTGDQVLPDSHQVESGKVHKHKKRSGSRGRKSSIERLTGQRHAIWRERNPRRFGDEDERGSILPEDELRAGDVTRTIRAEEIADDLAQAYTAKLRRKASR